MFKIDKILSLDQARSMGFSVWSINDKKLIDYGVKKFGYSKKYKEYDDFIFYAKLEMMELIRKHEISLVILEGVFGKEYAKDTFAKLSRLQAVLVNCLKENGTPYETIYPSQWKNYLKVANGNKTERKVEKQNSIKFVKEVFGIDVGKDDNIADAICMGYYYINKKYMKKG